MSTTIEVKLVEILARTGMMRLHSKVGSSNFFRMNKSALAGKMVGDYSNGRILVYLIECIIGLCVCYALYKSFPQHQFYWSMVSVVLVITPDGKNSNQLAFDRMKANVLGSSIGLLLFLVHQPNLFLICIGVTLTILIGIFLKLNAALRSSLSALVIVMINEAHDNSTWSVGVERMGCVIIGCIIGLLITISFNFLISLIKSK
ncbi:MAG: FUSC family protein [Ginsengibacter sp.]